MKRVLLITTLTAFALASCSIGGGTGDGTTGIRGSVVLGPTCPVELANSPCPPAPYAARITVKQGGDAIASYDTSPGGTFHIQLAPGTYTVEAEPLEENPIARMDPLPPVDVPSEGYAEITISFDSGIR